MNARSVLPGAAALLAILGAWVALPEARAEPPAAPAARAATPPIYPGEPPLGLSARSLRVLQEDEPIHRAPSDRSDRRGAAMRGAHLPIYASRAGPGCAARWYLVGPEAWVCGERAEVSSRSPLPARSEPEALPAGLPHDYYFVGPDGSFGYDHLAEVDVGVPDAQLEPGFAVAVLEIANRHGESFGLTTKQLWLPMRDVGPARPSELAGTRIDGDLESVAWTHSDATPVYRSPLGRRRDGESLPRHTELRIVSVEQRGSATWLSVGPSRWLRRRDVRRALLAPPPEGLKPSERWIDVSIAEQTVIAYEGSEPVFATLASTGRGPESSEQATPPGEYRIWVKLRTSDMTNLEDVEARRYYAMEEVPWVMFFERGYGLHGAYWHRSFGTVRSHGCVNLSPKDARWLFDWASPHLPAGWRAVLPASYDPGTIVRVHA